MPGYISWPLAVAVVYMISTVGSVFGGWLPKHFAQRGMDLNRARKLSMFLFALGPLAVLFASRLGEIHIWFAVLTIGIATAGAPGLVGQHLHHGIGHVPQARRGLGDRHRRHGWGGRRHPDVHGCRA